MTCELVYGEEKTQLFIVTTNKKSYVSLPMGRAWISTTRMVDNIVTRCEISIAKHCHDVLDLLPTWSYHLTKFDRQNLLFIGLRGIQDCARGILHARARAPIPCPCHAHPMCTCTWCPRVRKIPAKHISRAKTRRVCAITILSWIGIFRRDIVNSFWAPAKTLHTFRQRTVHYLKLLIQANLYLLQCLTGSLQESKQACG